jgi:hypothetical protein
MESTEHQTLKDDENFRGRNFSLAVATRILSNAATTQFKIPSKRPAHCTPHEIHESSHIWYYHACP